MINSVNLSKVKWTRDDFIRDNNACDTFLLNPFEIANCHSGKHTRTPFRVYHMC